jgi:hypothetical protein
MNGPNPVSVTLVLSKVAVRETFSPTKGAVTGLSVTAGVAAHRIRSSNDSKSNFLRGAALILRGEALRGMMMGMGQGLERIPCEQKATAWNALRKIRGRPERNSEMRKKRCISARLNFFPAKTRF